MARVVPESFFLTTETPLEAIGYASSDDSSYGSASDPPRPLRLPRIGARGGGGARAAAAPRGQRRAGFDARRGAAPARAAAEQQRRADDEREWELEREERMPTLRRQWGRMLTEFRAARRRVAAELPARAHHGRRGRGGARDAPPGARPGLRPPPPRPERGGDDHDDGEARRGAGARAKEGCKRSMRGGLGIVKQLRANSRRGPGVLGSRACQSVAATARAVGFGQPESEAPAAEITYTSS